MPTSRKIIGLSQEENIIVNDNVNLEPIMAKPIKFEQDSYTQGQIAKAAFERENTAVSSILEASYQLKFDNEIDPNFNIDEVIDGEIKGSKYEPYLESFLEFNNFNQVKALKDKIDKEEENTKILEDSGLTGIAWSLAAGILDPVNFIPIGGGVYKTYKAGKVAKGIALTAGAGTIGATTSEGILQATQETRTIEESAINIAGATLLAGVLGGSAAYISKRKFNNLAKKVEKDNQTETADIQINPETQKIEIKPETTTAKNVQELDAIKKYYNDILTPQLKAEGKEIPTFADFRKQQQSLISTITQDIAGAVKGEKVLKKINLIDNLNPIQRLTQTQYATAPKEVAEKLMKTGLMWNKNKIGIASAQSAEISKKTLQASYFNAYKPLEKKAFYNFQKRIKKEGAKNATEENILKATTFSEKLDKKIFGGSQEKFYEELSRALRNGDKSEIPEIEQLAKTARNEVISKLGKEAVNVGLLDEKILTTKPKTAESYFPRLWNKTKVIAKENDLRTLLKDKIKNILIPQIKNIELKKELNLNSRILFFQTRVDELTDYVEKVKELVNPKFKISKIREKKLNDIEINNIKADNLIPQEYKNIFQETIFQNKGNSFDDFLDDLSSKLPDSFEIDENQIQEIYNKYITGNKSFYDIDEKINLINQYKLANKSIKENKSKSLLTFLKERGGIVDIGGELKNLGITNKTYPFLIRKEKLMGGLFFDGKQSNNQSLSSAMEAAFEAGYFPEYTTRQDITENDLIGLIRQEINGEKVYSIKDLDAQLKIEEAQEFLNYLDQYGIDINSLKEEVKIEKGNIKKSIKIEKQNTRALKENVKIEKANKLVKFNLNKLEYGLAKAEMKTLNKKIEILKKQYDKNALQVKEKFDQMGNQDQYIEEITTNIINNLKGEDRLGLIDDLGIKIAERGPLKERTLNFVQDNELEPWLENDGSKVLNYYQNTMATDIEVARAFDGDLTLDNEIARINEEYLQAKKGITDLKILKNIERERKKVINDIDSTLKIMRGMYARPDDPDSIIVRGGKIAREFNYITKMGQVAISSITDLANPIRKHGLKTWAKTLPNLITNLQGIKLNVKEAKLAGNITDRVMPERMASFSGLNDSLSSNLSSFEKLISNISNGMSKINLMPLWNDSQKAFSSVVSQQRMVNAISKYDSANEKDITYLGYLGIGRDNYKIIANELKKYAYKEDGLWVANTEKWKNPEAVRIYRNALNIDVDSTIVSVGAGDLPLWMQTEVGKVVGQFKSFTFGATQQVLASGLQQKDMAVLNGLISATALGMMSYYFRKKLANKEVSNKPEVWISEGLDRSGYFGILTEYSHIADKVGLGVSTLSGVGQLSRYQTRDFASSLLGPSVDLLGNAAISVNALRSQEITEADAKAIRRMIPLNNTLILTTTMDNFEKSIANK